MNETSRNDENLNSENQKNESKPDEKPGGVGDIQVVDKRHWNLEEEEKMEGRERNEHPSFVEELKDEIDTLKEKTEKYSKALKKRKEENEKFRSRMNRDFDKKVEMAKKEFLAEFLEILDNFDLALQTGNNDEDPEALFEGVTMIYKQLQDKLRQQGVKPMEVEGNEYDPEISEAVDIVEVDMEEKHDKVVEVVRKGYYYQDSVMRPARVKVGKYKEEEKTKGESAREKSTDEEDTDAEG